MGIKLKPTAIAHLFGLPMKDLVDRVINLDKRIKIDVNNVDEWFNDLCRNYPVDHPADKAVDLIFSKKGMVTIAEVCKDVSVSERYLQQLFQKYVGLSPKFFRESGALQLHLSIDQRQRPDWAQVVYEAGYYDQSHFIRNFKAFTGEDPSEYIFAEKTLANFFMKKIA